MSDTHLPKRAKELPARLLAELFPHHPAWKVRAAVLRLLWCQHFVTDLTALLSERHELRHGPATVVGVADATSLVP